MSKSRNVYDGKIAGLYDLGDTLGRGHFAVVKLARHVFTNEKVAVKVIDKMKLDEVSRAHLFQEVRCMKLVQHPNVVRLYEVIDTQTKLYLILELGDGGDMYDYIMKHEKGLDEEAARKYFRQIVHAISYCHRLHVVHRDLKPENVVFFEKLGMVKLTDFGFSNRFCPGQKLETSCGSLAYSAPEILLGDSYDAPAVDVWSLGVILYMLVCGHPPFQEANDSETLTMIMDCKYTIPSHVSLDCSRLIQKMLIRDPEIRATLDEITNHPWLECTHTIQHADYLPLVSREHLSEEDHKHILQKMANGNIATQEDIASALDKNAYNHITATYFLLAERKLRAIRQEQAKLLNASHVSDLSALAISPRNPAKPCLTREDNLPRTVESLLSPQESRRTLGSPVASCILDSPQNCHCRSRSNSKTSCGSPPLSILSDCSTVNQIISPASSIGRFAILPSPSKGKCDSLDMRKKKHASFAADNDLNVNMIEIDKVSESCIHNENLSSVSDTDSSVRMGSVTSLRPNLHSFAANKFRPVTSPNNRKLHSVRSSPQLTLNEIYEEVESEGELSTHTKFNPCHSVNKTGVTTTRVLQSHQSIASPAVLRKYEQRRRYAKARTASCSSSDASDEDTDTRKRKAEKLKRMPGWSDRRWEDDDDDPNHGSGPQGGNGIGGNRSEGGGGVGNDGDRRGPTGDPPPSASQERHPSSPERHRPADSSVSQYNTVEGSNDETSTSEKSKGSCNTNIGVSSNQLHSSPALSYTSESSLSSAKVFHSAASVTRCVLGTTSPPQSPLCTPSITSLRQSKTLNQINHYVSPTASLLGSPVLDSGNKENRILTRHNSPLHFLNLKRTSRYRPPSYPGSSVTTTPISNNLDSSLSPRINYKHGLYRLLKHAPHLGSKRWDINRNGLNSPDSSVVSSSSPPINYNMGLQVTSTSSSSPSHSKCCSLC